MSETENIQNRDFVRVGKSKIQGKGVFAKRKIQRGTRIIEYLGDRITHERLMLDIEEGQPFNVYIFGLSQHLLIDGNRNGNEARFINHSCDPNCEAYIFGDQVFIYAMRDITRGEELTFDYNLTAALDKKTKIDPSVFACTCGAPNCRGTMMAVRKRNRKKSA